MPKYVKRTFLPFAEARDWARALGLRSTREWRARTKEGLPAGIPVNADQVYPAEWKGWGDWLGTGSIAPQNKTFRSFESAKAWVQENGIRSDKQWLNAVRAGLVPADIPRSPRLTYPNDWTTSGGFYGTGFISYRRRKWVPLAEAKRWASEHGIYSREDWMAASKAKLLPANIPGHPLRVYPECNGAWDAIFDTAVRGGASFTEEVFAHEVGLFLPVDRTVRSIGLGNGRTKRVDIAIPSKKILIEYDGWYWHKKSQAKDRRETEQLAAQGWRVVRVRESPLEPICDDDCVVSAKLGLHERVSTLLSHLLLRGLLPSRSRTRLNRYIADGRLHTALTSLASHAGWMTFDDAREIARSLKLKSEPDFRRYCKRGSLPERFPSAPAVVYESQWKGWGDFLGTGRTYSRPGSFRSFQSSRRWVKASGIKTYAQWNEGVRAAKIPIDIPRRPYGVYKDEWVSFAHWFGLKVTPGHRTEWRSFSTARRWARESGAKSEHEWRVLVKRDDFPEDVPKAPYWAYKPQWKGWGDWLGTGTVAPQKVKFQSFEKARRFARSLGLTTCADWLAYKRSTPLPPGIPAHPWNTYRNHGWVGIRDWLGSGD